MTILLCVFIYGSVGIIFGRVWWTVWTRKGDDFLPPLSVALGLIWPLMLVLIPLVAFIVWAWPMVVAPPFRWLFKWLDRAVAAVVPEKNA